MNPKPGRNIIICFATIAFLSRVALIAGNWPEWRGPNGNGVSLEKNLPTAWSTNQNIVWKVTLPEAGNSTPVVWGNKVFLTQAIENRRTIICLDRRSGKLLWQSGVVASEKEPTHETNPYCSGSPATDGQRVVASFGSAGVYCYDFDGKELWHRDLGKQSHMWGISSSPIIHGEICFLNFGPGERTFLIALNKKTGETIWQHDEPGGKSDKYIGSWATPLTIKHEREELIVPYPGRVASFDP
ncbi:MAG: hypothetical protein JWM99_2753, partial [Verrucomicrobiales bacterium]|nr:hypothetical protein [Verrucomicrobiales bacterium]